MSLLNKFDNNFESIRAKVYVFKMFKSFLYKVFSKLFNFIIYNKVITIWNKYIEIRTYYFYNIQD